MHNERMNGKQLRAWRLSYKFRVKDMATVLGISDDTYGRMERRERLPRWVGLACQAHLLRLDPELKDKA